jgi:peptide/nickel transport system permease protein
MGTYLVRRVVLFVPVLFLVSLVIFSLVRLLPGDTAVVMLMAGGEGQATGADIERLRDQLGLNQPLPRQYVTWLFDLVRLDFGKSFYTGRPVLGELVDAFPRTLELATLTLLLAVVIAVPLGSLSAVHQGGRLDQVIRVTAIGGVAAPSFWIGTLLILVLARSFNWIPPLGYRSFLADPWVNLQQMIFPALALGYGASAALTRMTRSTMLEVLRQDYVRTARAKGIRETTTLLRHALPNAGLPILTLAGLQFAALLGGSVVIETVFVLPGVGSLLVNSIQRRDYFVTQGIIVSFALIVVLLNLLVDLLYGWLDPRIRYA